LQVYFKDFFESKRFFVTFAAMKKQLNRVVELYVGGFREMTVGRSLWVLIIVKLIVLFGVLKLFFFPDVLSRDYDSDAERARAVRSTLVDR